MNNTLVQAWKIVNDRYNKNYKGKDILTADIKVEVEEIETGHPFYDNAETLRNLFGGSI